MRIAHGCSQPHLFHPAQKACNSNSQGQRPWYAGPFQSKAQKAGRSSRVCESSQEENGRPFRPLAVGRYLYQGRWPWLVELLALWAVGVMSISVMPASAMAADEPEIHVATSAEEIFVGESIDFQVEIRNTKNPSAPDMTDVKQQFDVVANGDESRNQSSTFIVNGRVSQQNVYSHLYHFRLTPKVAGSLTIPPVTAMVDGKKLVSSRVSLRVIEIEKQDLVLVEIETNHAKVYPTQPFAVTLRVLVKPLPDGVNRDPLSPLRKQPPHLQINWVETPKGLVTDEVNRWLQPLLADDGVGFTLNELTRGGGFLFDGPRAHVFNLFKGRESRDGLDGKPIRYFVYELSRTFTPEKTGDYSFGPAVIKGTFVVGAERNEYTARRLVASSEAVTVEVSDVPLPRPATFCGGIGEYKVSASASPTKLRIGDPLTLTLEFERGSQSGSLELISAPDLSTNAQLMQDFDLIDKNPTGRVEGLTKKFTYAMRPKHLSAGIPSLTVFTFDPQSEEYVGRKTAAISLDVTEAARVTGGDLIGSMPSTGSIEMKSRAEGIFQNITDPSEVRDERISLVAYCEAALGLWCATGCLIAVVTVYRRKSTDNVWVRRQGARRAASRRLAEARRLMSQGQSMDALRLIRASIIGLVADTRNRIAEGLTTIDVDEVLSQASVPVDERSKIVQLLESIESAEYGATQSADPSTAIEAATSMIARVAPHLERGA